MRDLTARIAARRAYDDQRIDPHSALTLVRERDNDHDRAAVRVDAESGPVGYLETGMALLVARELDRGRPVFAAPVEGRQGALTLYVLEPRDRLPGRTGANLVAVTSSDGSRQYVVNHRRSLCTCVAGRWVHCRHKKAAGAPQLTRVGARARRAAVAVSA